MPSGERPAPVGVPPVGLRRSRVTPLERSVRGGLRSGDGVSAVLGRFCQLSLFCIFSNEPTSLALLYNNTNGYLGCCSAVDYFHTRNFDYKASNHTPVRTFLCQSGYFDSIGPGT